MKWGELKKLKLLVSFPEIATGIYVRMLNYEINEKEKFTIN